jgi:hypothetical protein
VHIFDGVHTHFIQSNWYAAAGIRHPAFAAPMVQLQYGSAYDPALPEDPTFLVVSIQDTVPPSSDNWKGGTSLGPFYELMLNRKSNAHAAQNSEACVAAWNWMRQSLPGAFANGPVHSYYVQHPQPAPVYHGVHLKTPRGASCFTLLMHAPDFGRTGYDKAMGLLVSSYRVVRALCSLRGGRAETARIVPLSAGVFAGKTEDDRERNRPLILRACVNELFTPFSAPVAVFAYSDGEKLALHGLMSPRAQQLGMNARLPPPPPVGRATPALRQSLSTLVGASTRTTTRPAATAARPASATGQPTGQPTLRSLFTTPKSNNKVAPSRGGAPVPARRAKPSTARSPRRKAT